jgi:hypothetical protein
VLIEVSKIDLVLPVPFAGRPVEAFSPGIFDGVDLAVPFELTAVDVVVTAVLESTAVEAGLLALAPFELFTEVFDDALPTL